MSVVINIYLDFVRLQMSEPRKSLDETDDADESSDDERSYETPEEKRKKTKFQKYLIVIWINRLIKQI